MKLDGLELDLVNLRSETYADTRIPEMSFGTPTQDAERRDFTVNSLFYNINTEEVSLHSCIRGPILGKLKANRHGETAIQLQSLK